MDLLPSFEKHLAFIVEQSAGAEKEAIVSALLDLDNLLCENRDGLPPKLKHYLEGRSYHKALAEVRALMGK